MSRIGKKPVELPSGVSATVSGQTVEVKGPKGTRSFTATDDVTIKSEDNVITVNFNPMVCDEVKITAVTVVIKKIANNYKENNGPEYHVIVNFRVLKVSGSDNGNQ